MRSLDGPTQPHGVGPGLGRDPGNNFGVPGFAFLVDHRVAEPVLDESGPHGAGVVALVEMDSLDVQVKVVVPDRVQRGGQQRDVMTVGAIEGPTDRDPVAVGRKRPLMPQLPSIHRAFAGSFTPARGPVDRPVNRDVVEIKTDDPIESRDGMSGDDVEQIGVNPLVISGPDGRVGHHVPAQFFGIDPRASRDEPDQHDPDCGGVVGEDPNNVCAAFHFFVEPLERVVRPHFPPKAFGERTEREDVGPGVSHRAGGLREPVRRRVGHFVVAVGDLLRCAESEDRPERGRDHLLMGFGDGRGEVAGVMDLMPISG